MHKLSVLFFVMLMSVSAAFAQTPHPQEPKPPFDYVSEEVEFENTIDTVTLAGTFTKPKGEGKFPAVILVSGSGAQNRNEELMGHKPFLLLADYLTRKGIAVLRYDDRGTAESTGTYAGTSVDDFARDAKTALEFLKLRKDVDVQKIGIIGHSEGGQIAQIVAAEMSGVSFIVSMAGPGVNGVEILVSQTEAINRSMNLPDSTVKKNTDLQRRLITMIAEETNPDMLRAKMTVEFKKMYAEMDANAKQMMTEEQMVNTGLKQVMSVELQSIIRHDPKLYYPKIKCPVLAINGSKDIQVLSGINLKGWKDGLGQQVLTREFEGLNHLFQHCTACTVPEYGTISETISPEVLDVIAVWIQQHTGLRK